MKSASSPYLRPSQANIAKLAGVSRPTVTLVLNGESGPSPQTREKVLRVARKLGYRPNLLVRGMKSGRSQTVGVVVPPFDSYWAEVLCGIHDELVRGEYSPLLMWAHHSFVPADANSPRQVEDRSATDGLKVIYQLLDRRVDAVILWPPFALLYEQHIQEFLSRQIPVITIDHDLPRPFQSHSVSADDRGGGRLAARHLLDLGHRRLGHLTGYLIDSWARDRKEAFEKTVRAAGTATCETVAFTNGDVVTDIATEFLRRKQRPTAIFAGTDTIAQDIYKAAARLRLKIPRDLSVVGFSDLSSSAWMHPALTTIRPNSYQIGRSAAELAVSLIADESSARGSQKKQIPVQLIERASTAAPK